ncbi:MAG TPA: nucleotidyltransferase domain-containing protein [Dysgonamonadaceae bacterium]|uniref:nucleotidyltransferase domain-containing protein n=1 Tax=Seramator thermalis TaxID=2496270 RepID=UPI000C71773B|nr:nucleotidyltransferase domain-containing protein [Seramator thermalis]PLB85867.1 nucleotidyltransferase domain-containing protein [Dysgonamonadaceae bacterium]HOM63713.1 nucleotidyltransferase domain-containing protein [Dysgonamonadaceae bacterium]HPD44260.1 nucleotidyltransferase domain-containing protein [Dysgonamonadaceae bacterium]
MQSVFDNFPNVEEVLIFGSRATGNYREGSDIDLAIIGSNITFDEILEISSRIDDLGLLYNVDVLNYDQQKGTSIGNEIDKYGKTFYRKKANRIAISR